MQMEHCFGLNCFLLTRQDTKNITSSSASQTRSFPCNVLDNIQHFGQTRWIIPRQWNLHGFVMSRLNECRQNRVFPLNIQSW